jgi:site-specific DNA-methyltransferase (cytosine-N4-specific)
LHPYPAKFIPQIPGSLIEIYSREGDLVLDPFCGSGTTLLEAILRGRKTIGVDVNPIATLVSRVKVTVFTAQDRSSVLDFLRQVDEILLNMHMRLGWLGDAVSDKEIPKFYNIEHWFQPNVRRELTLLKRIIQEYACADQVRDFLKVCFSSIIVKVSNQESDTRWVAVDKSIADNYTINCFREAIGNNLEKMMNLAHEIGERQPRAQVISADIADVPEFVNEHTVDLVVTSPPYFNSYDYYLYHKLRMFWLGYDHKEVQSREIGSRNKHCDYNLGIDAFVDSISKAFACLSKVVKPSGKYAFVVGDAIYKGKLVRMDLLYDKILDRAGLRVVDITSFDQRKYSRSFTPNLKKQYKESHIMVLERK